MCEYLLQKTGKTENSPNFESYHINLTNIKIKGFSGSIHIHKCFGNYLLRELGGANHYQDVGGHIFGPEVEIVCE